MASISREANGRRTIQFLGADGKRRSIRLGKIPQRTAEAIKVKVEHLIAAALSRHALDDETARWVRTLDTGLADKLAAAGLIPKPGNTKLGEFLENYVASRTDVKPNTIRNMEMAKRNLVDFFGVEKKLLEINQGDADDWFRFLKQKGLSEATIGRRVKRAKQFFIAAQKRKILAENPFRSLAAPAQVNATRAFFVTREMATKVIEACPDAQWRLIFALSRYGGLRCPSEHLALRWHDVDWEQSRISIPSPKTGFRVIPIFPELKKPLEEVFAEAESGTEFVITRYRDSNTNLRTQLHRIIKRAGLKPWPKLFQNLRASRETELTEEFPIHVVCEWIGNSELIAAKHYLQVTDEHFAQATMRAAKSGALNADFGGEALQNPVQQPAAVSRTKSHKSKDSKEMSEAAREYATPCESVQIATVPPRGVEPLSPG